jgi:hypothetical protein
LKQWKIKNLIDDINQIKEKNTQKLNSAKLTEVKNEKGVSKEAKLNITVISLKKLEENNLMSNLISLEPYIKMTLNKEERKTGLTSGNNNTNNKFFWNEEFEFSIIDLNQNIILELYDKKTILNSSLGKIVIKLKDYAHQNKVQEILKFKVEEQEIGYVLELKISLIWSYVKLYESVIDKLELRESKFNEEYLELTKYESLIKKPFGLLLIGEYDYLINNLDVEPEIGAIGRKTIIGKNPLTQSKQDFFRQSLTNNSMNKNYNTQSNRDLLSSSSLKKRCNYIFLFFI